MNPGGGLNRPRASETDPPSFLEWMTAPLAHDVDVIGPIELQLDASCTAPDTAFIAVLQDLDESGNATNITAGYLRAGVRTLDEEQSKQAAPVLPCKTFEAVPVPKAHIWHSASAQCSTLQGRSQDVALSHVGRPKQGCPGAARI